MSHWKLEEPVRLGMDDSYPVSCAGTYVRFLLRAYLQGFTIVCCSAHTEAGFLLSAGTAAELNEQASHDHAAPHDDFQRPRSAHSVLLYDDGKAGSKSPAWLGCTIRPSGMKFGSAETKLRRLALLSLVVDFSGQRLGLLTV